MTLVPTLLDPDATRVCVAPPPNFRPLGDAKWTRLAGSRPPSYGRTAAQRGGIRYELKVNRWLKRRYPRENTDTGYFESPVLEVMNSDGSIRVLVPDGLFLYDDVATVIEIKSRHMPESWWQLNELYGPAVKLLPLVGHVNLLTIVRSYDPAMPYPGETARIDKEDLDIFLANTAKKIGVLVWR